MSIDLVLKAIADSLCPISTQAILNKVAGVENIEQISKTVYHLWKRGKIRRHVINGRYAYSLADAEENIALPPEAKMTTITPTPTRLSEAKAQAVRRLREAVVTESQSSPPITAMPSEDEPLAEPMATIPPEKLLLPEDVDLPTPLPQFNGDPVLQEITLGMRQHAIRNSSVHVTRLRALALWSALSPGVSQWLVDLAKELESKSL